MSQSQKEAAEYAEVLLAYSRGERVQMRLFSADPWRELDYPLWDFGRYEYRAVPKPREWWVVPDTDNNLLNASLLNIDQRASLNLIKVREVTE